MRADWWVADEWPRERESGRMRTAGAMGGGKSGIENVDGRPHYRLPDGSLVSTTDRFCRSVPPVATRTPSDDQVFEDVDGRSLPCTDYIREHLRAEGRLSREQILRIIEDGTALLRTEPNLLRLPAPVVICGDVHGQYYDLLKMMVVAGGGPPAQRLLFLGDYVDRGVFSLEVYVYLLALKLRHPECVSMLRGNHECRHLTRHFTFRAECASKYGEDVYEACMASFDALPLAALVNNQFFCVHGGIGPDLKRPEDVDALDRFREVPRSGLFCDLLWADPAKDYASDSCQGFASNRARGCSYSFGFSAVVSFLRANGLLAVVRGHEAQDEGFRLYRSSRHASADDFPSLITVFSAANYVDVYKNKGAVVRYDGSQLNVRQFACAPHPYALPNFMNAFSWSLPFVAERVAHVMAAALQLPESLAGPIATMTDAERSAVISEAKELSALDERMALRAVEDARAEAELTAMRREAEAAALAQAASDAASQSKARELQAAAERAEASIPALEAQAAALGVLEAAVSVAAASPDLSVADAAASVAGDAAAVDALEAKVTAVEVMADGLAELRSFSEASSELNDAIGALPSDGLAGESLAVAQDVLVGAVQSFGDARKCDEANERLPPAAKSTATTPLSSPLTVALLAGDHSHDGQPQP